jgi:ferredoxin-NADP reductase/CRP-like cAMP-binding protein/cytochrome P450
VTADAIAAALRRCGLFAGFAADRLDALVRVTEDVVLAPGIDVIREGEAGDAMFVVLQGAMQVYTRDRNGREVVLARLEAGDHFGEQALLPGSSGHRNSSVRAIGTGRLARVPKAAFQTALAADDVLRERLIELGAGQVRDKLQRLSPLARGIGLDGVTPRRRALAAGEVLFRQGEEADALYVVSAGRLAVWREDDDGRTLLRYVERGGCVGELALVRKERRSATVTAEEPAEVLEVPRAEFDRLYSGSTVVREYLATLERAYELPRRGLVTQHAGTFAGHDCITTLYHLTDGTVFAAYRVVGQDLYALERLDAGPVETLTWGQAGARSRELRLGGDGTVVGVTARGEWADAHALHLFVLDGARIGAAGRKQFSRTGTLDLAPADVSPDVICHCVHVSGDLIRSAIKQGAGTFNRLQRLTGCGTVCGGCVPTVVEMLGAEDWVLADVAAERDEAPGIRSFELAPREASYPDAAPGQHVVVEGLVRGLRVRRPYTVSSPLRHGGRLRITVKRENDGVFSRWLFDDRPKDQPLRITRPRGTYVIDSSARHVVCLVAGIGVTPAVAAARTAAASGQPPRMLIHYSGRARDRMACVQELEALADGNIRLIVRETAREGRLDGATLMDLVRHAPDADYYLCGPPTYLDQVGQMLRRSGVDTSRIHLETFTPVGSAPVVTAEQRAAWRRELIVPPEPPRARPVHTAVRRAGGSLVSLANSPLTDWRVGPAQLNPLRWLESRLGRAAGLDPDLPLEHLAMISALAWGPFECQIRGFDRLAARGAANRERARRARSERRTVPSCTPDGATFTCWAPTVAFPAFPAEWAVDTGWTRTGPGRLAPIYVTRSRTALRCLLGGEDVERAPMPYHFVQQVTGRTDARSCPGRKASGLIAGQLHDNATWSEDRALAADMFAFPVIDGFTPIMAAALDEVCAALDDAVEDEPSLVFDLDVLLSGLAHEIILRALVGNVDTAELHGLGRDLSRGVERLLAHVCEFVMGRRSIPRDYAEAQRTVRTASRTLVDRLQDLGRRDRLSDAQHATPTIRIALETAGESGGTHERFHALFLPLIIAGHETTGHTLSWALYEMARSPAVERAVLGEIETFHRARGRRPLTTAEYDERPVAWALLAETLRRHPPVQSVSRTTREAGVIAPDPDTGIGRFRYPAGATILLSIVGVHLDPGRWADPRTFRLERWFEGVREGMQPAEKGRAVRHTIHAREQALDWIPFADGQSRCPGRHFSAHEFFLALDALLPRYRFDLTHPDHEIRESETMVVGPERGRMAVRIVPRR